MATRLRRQKMPLDVKTETEAPHIQPTGLQGVPANHKKDKNDTRKDSGL